MIVALASVTGWPPDTLMQMTTIRFRRYWESAKRTGLLKTDG